MRAVLRMLASQLRRDRWVLTWWVGGIGLFAFAVASAVTTQFTDLAGRTALVALAVGNPAVVFARGLPDGADLGAVVFFTGYVFIAVLAALMSTFLVVRHTRADEEAGRGELLGSTAIARAAPLAATLLLGTLAAAAVTLLVAAGLVAGGLPASGSSIAALAVGSVALVFVGLAALLAQAMPTGRAANGAASALVAGAYIARGAGDALGTPSDDLQRVTPGWGSWLSPIGWGQATRPFTEPTLLPLAVSLVVFAVCAGAALAVRSRRDLGASLVPERHGRATAGIGGRSLPGLAWRQHRLALLGWTIGVVVLGALAGGLAPVLADAVDDNPALAALISRFAPGDAGATAEAFIAALLAVGGMLAAAAGVQAVLRLRSDEAEGRAELLLAVPTTRARWAGSSAIVAAASVLVSTAALGLVTGAAFARSSGDGDGLPRMLGAGLAHAPAALVLVGMALLAFALAPRSAATISWGMLVVGFVVGQFGELLQLPDWLRAASPFFHTAAVPVDAPDPVALAVLVAIAMLTTGLGLIVLRRRDLAA